MAIDNKKPLTHTPLTPALSSSLLPPHFLRFSHPFSPVTPSLSYPVLPLHTHPPKTPPIHPSSFPFPVPRSPLTSILLHPQNDPAITLHAPVLPPKSIPSPPSYLGPSSSLESSPISPKTLLNQPNPFTTSPIPSKNHPILPQNTPNPFKIPPPIHFMNPPQNLQSPQTQHPKDLRRGCVP